MLVSKKTLHKPDFSVLINQILIETSKCVKYLGLYFDNKLIWKIHADKLCKKVSKVNEKIYKLQYNVPLFTLL